jgi:hypothetical protein
MEDLLDKTRMVSRALQNRKEGASPDIKVGKTLCDLSLLRPTPISSIAKERYWVMRGSAE